MIKTHKKINNTVQHNSCISIQRSSAIIEDLKSQSSLTPKSQSFLLTPFRYKAHTCSWIWVFFFKLSFHHGTQLICFWDSLLTWPLLDPLCREKLFLGLFLLMELAFIIVAMVWSRFFCWLHFLGLVSRWVLYLLLLYLREDLSCCPQHLSSVFLYVLVTLALYFAGCKSRSKGSSLKPHITGNLIHDWWFGIQLNPQFMGIDLKFFFVRAGMMGWLLINLSVLAKSIQDGTLSKSMILFQLFCALYILDYFVHEEYMTSTWDIIAERLGFMLVFGDLVWIPFTFSIQGWWLLANEVELTTAAIIANCLVFLIGYMVFRGANKQKHVFKKNSKAPIWGKPPKVIGGKLLASGYCSPVPYFYPIYLLILLIWRERRDESRCAEKYKEIWSEYEKLVPWRILPYVY
nr:delta(14)-sterol reductase-like isoform X2 [Arachis hypogaea]XP_025663564.1 delta(14)-sterol reductase-like isoform X2 [Arachis hypogaea]